MKGVIHMAFIAVGFDDEVEGEGVREDVRLVKEVIEKSYGFLILFGVAHGADNGVTGEYIVSVAGTKSIKYSIASDLGGVVENGQLHN